MRRAVWIVAALVVVGGGLAWRFGFAAPAPEVRQARAPAPIPVVAGTAQTQDVPVYVTGIGAVQAYNTVTVKVRVDGELQKVSFTEGQDVKAGDLLAQIDPRPYAASLAQAQATKAKDMAQLTNAKIDQERYKTLVAKNAASQQTLDTQNAQVAQYEAAVQGDQAAIDNAQVQLGYTTITAPIAGRTGVRQVDQGNIVRTTDTTGLVVITQLKPISVIFAMPQDRLDELVAAMHRGPVEVLAFKRDGTTQLGTGKVELIDNQIDSNTGTLRVKATFANDDLKLWPGAFVNVQVQVRMLTAAVTVPAQVVQRGADGLFVYVIKPDNTVEKRTITLGPTKAGMSVVASGLTAGEQVVVDGQLKLTPGARISVTGAAPPPPAAAPVSDASTKTPA